MTASNTVLFEERQRFRQVWLWALMLGLFAGEWVLLAVMLRQSPAGSAYAAWSAGAGVTALLVVFLWTMELRTRVTPGHVELHFFPLLRKRIEWRDVASAEPRTYRPIVEYGGWGIRYALAGRGQAYNVSGNRGVQLELTSGKRILIGSARSDELAAAIRAARREQGATVE